MRWEALFTDMELQLDAADAQDRALQVADLTRAERATVALCDRIRGGLGRSLSLTVRSGDVVTGEVDDVGPAWVLLSGAGGREHLVPLAAVVVVRGDLDVVAPPATPALRRLGLGHALRAVARDRAVVRITTAAGSFLGRIDAVGADHLDVGLVDEGSRRPSGERQLVAFTGLDLLSSV